jgi:hypothetical protein
MNGFLEALMCRRAIYQYYTNVNYASCKDCLAWHGVLRHRRDAFPTPDDGCESAILAIPVKQRRAYRQQAKYMRLRAQGELARREMFAEAMDLLTSDADAALTLLERAADIDLYIPDIERLADRHGAFLNEHADIKERLRVQLRKAYSDKFGWRRYERLPEVMRLQREQAGVRRIDELFGS